MHTGSDGSSNQQRASVRRVNRSRSIRTISRDCNGRLTTLVKSGSFSGCTARPETASEKLIVSDPTSADQNLSYCRSETSTADTEDNTFCSRTKNCSVYKENPLDTVPIGVAALNADSDVEKNSLGNNSFSEQAWDSYQVCTNSQKHKKKKTFRAPNLRLKTEKTTFFLQFFHFKVRKNE